MEAILDSSESEIGRRAAPSRSAQTLVHASLFVILPIVLAVTTIASIQFLTGRPIMALMSGRILSVEQPKIMLSAKSGDKVECQFKVTNVSGKPLKLLGFNSDCSCTTSKTNFPITLQPNGSTSITVRVAVGEPSSDGKFVRGGVMLLDHEGALSPFIIEVHVIGSVP